MKILKKVLIILAYLILSFLLGDQQRILKETFSLSLSVCIRLYLIVSRCFAYSTLPNFHGKVQLEIEFCFFTCQLLHLDKRVQFLELRLRIIVTIILWVLVRNKEFVMLRLIFHIDYLKIIISIFICVTSFGVGSLQYYNTFLQ